MAQVRGRDTKPEILVRKALKKLHVRFSTARSGIPGSPDIVLPRLKLAVFVNGCFWHWHGCKRSRMPSSNIDYWEQKIARNLERDKRTKRALTAAGWHYWTIWECRLPIGVSRLMARIRALEKEASDGHVQGMPTGR